MDCVCSCCGNRDLKYREFNVQTAYGGTVFLRSPEFKHGATAITHARVCFACGNIMPCISSEVLGELRAKENRSPIWEYKHLPSYYRK